MDYSPTDEVFINANIANTSDGVRECGYEVFFVLISREILENGNILKQVQAHYEVIPFGHHRAWCVCRSFLSLNPELT